MYIDPINSLIICKSEVGEYNAQLCSSMCLCFICHRYVSCVPNNVTVSGLSFIIDPSVFDNISLTTSDIKLRSVQYRPLHRILPRNNCFWLR